MFFWNLDLFFQEVCFLVGQLKVNLFNLEFIYDVFSLEFDSAAFTLSDF